MSKFCIHFEGVVEENRVSSLEVRKLEGSKINLAAGVFCIITNVSAGFDVDEAKLIELVNEGIKLSESGLFE